MTPNYYIIKLKLFLEIGKKQKNWLTTGKVISETVKASDGMNEFNESTINATSNRGDVEDFNRSPQLILATEERRSQNAILSNW